MGVDLYSYADASIEYFNWRTWQSLFRLAEEYGWQPEWPRDEYFWNNGDLVSDQDARNLASALGRALRDSACGVLPDRPSDVGFQRSAPGLLGKIPEVLPVSYDDETGLFACWATDEGRRDLKKFIRYCKRAGFYIW